MTSTITVNQADRYVNLATVRIRTGRNSAWVYRMVMLGKIRTHLEPGMPPAYHSGDVERIVAEDPR